MFIIELETVNEMQFKSICGVEIFRPRRRVELLIRRAAERHLRDSYPCGTYSDPIKVNTILRHQFGYFHRLLGDRLPEIASRQALQFLLHQYGQTSKIESQYKEGNLSSEELAFWNRWGPMMRRSIKYLAECVALLEPRGTPRAVEHLLLQLTEECTICAEELVDLYIQSDQTFMLFPDETVLTIHPEGSNDYLDLTIRDIDRYEIRPRIERDMRNKCRFIPSPPFPLDFKNQAVVLDGAFQKSFGFTWTNAMCALKHLIDTALVPDEGFDIPFCRRDMVIDGMSENIPGATPVTAEQFLEGFSLPVKKMREEGREVFRSKQEYRALRRGFFEFSHWTGSHIVWSREMARECLLKLTEGVAFQGVPPEWRNAQVDAALADLSNRSGKWFEEVTKGNVGKVGIVGRKSIKGVGIGEARIAVPGGVGEIDFVGYSSAWRLLVLLECKMVNGAFEPKYMRNDISAFVTADKSYASKFRHKIEWVRNNLESICTGLETIIPAVSPIAPTHVATAMVTLHPTLASVFITDFPCVSLTELMLDIEEQGEWPYTKGVFAG